MGESRLPVFCRCRVLRRRQAGREHHGLDFAGTGRHRPYRRRPPAGTNRTCPRRQAYAAVLHHYQRYGASHYLPYGLPNDHSGEEPEILFQNLRAGQPLLCRPAGMRMRPEMQEYHEAQRTGTRPRRLLQSRCRRHAR